jgi:hypothetical protein
LIPVLRVIYLLALLLPATPTLGANATSAEMSSEATNCFAFYVLLRRCAPLDAIPGSLAMVKSWAKRASDIAARYGKAAGMTDTELNMMHGAAIESVAAEMGNSCDGFSAVRTKYLITCKALLEDPEKLRR